MSEKEIKDLIKRYAEKNIYPPKTGVSLVDDIINGNSMVQEYIQSSMADIEKFMQWLSDRYEIVAKEKIREEYNKIQNSMRDSINPSGYIHRCDAQLKLLESLFPQTLKPEEK